MPPTSLFRGRERSRKPRLTRCRSHVATSSVPPPSSAASPRSAASASALPRQAVTGTAPPRRPAQHHPDHLLGQGAGAPAAGGRSSSCPARSTVVRAELGAKAEERPRQAAQAAARVRPAQRRAHHRRRSRRSGSRTARSFSSSAYRPQEILCGHVADAMVREINEIGSGPGDRRAAGVRHPDRRQLRHAQYNEIRWNIDSSTAARSDRLRRPHQVRGRHGPGPDVLRP